MADMTLGLIGTKEKAPAIVRSGGRGGAPNEWEKVVNPLIAGDPGEEFILFIYPEGDLPEGGWTDEDIAGGKRQAAARAAAIANRYWHHVPGEHVETMVRQRSDGTYGVFAVHKGAMTPENRVRLAKRRAPRGPHSAQDGAGAPETDAVAPDATEAPSTATAKTQTTAAERVKAAAAAKKG